MYFVSCHSASRDQQRIEKANRYAPCTPEPFLLVPWQETAYLIKEEQARRVIKGETSDIGFIQDEAQFRKLPLEAIANLVIAKADNLKFQIMKIERIRIKTQMATNTVKTKEDVQNIRATLAEESFVSMLM